MPQRIADAHSRQGVALAERAGNNHVVKFTQERYGNFLRECRVRLVNQQHFAAVARVRRQIPQHIQWERYAGRGVRVRQGNGAGKAQTIHIHRKIGLHRHRSDFCAVQIRINWIKRVRYRRNGDGFAREKRRKRKRQHFVRAVAAEHPVRRDTLDCTDGFAQGSRIHIRVQAQGSGIERAQHLSHARRRGIRILVRVELDKLAVFRLLTCNVRSQAQR